jgi:nicotinamidase-related amidase
MFPEKPSRPQRSPSLLDAARSVLVIVDAQEKFAAAIADLEAVGARIAILAKAAARLGVPVIVSEQYSKALGPTLADIRAALPEGAPVIEKICFSCGDSAEWNATLATLKTRFAAKRDQLVLCGVEAHVCVLQTALDLARHPDAAIYVVEDAVSSRKAAALRRLEAHGVQAVTTEMVVFEWLREAGRPEFKELQGLIK